MDKDEILDMKIVEIEKMLARMDKRLEKMDDRMWSFFIGQWTIISVIVGLICLITQI